MVNCFIERDSTKRNHLIAKTTKLNLIKEKMKPIKHPVYGLFGEKKLTSIFPLICYDLPETQNITNKLIEGFCGHNNQIIPNIGRCTNPIGLNETIRRSHLFLFENAGVWSKLQVESLVCSNPDDQGVERFTKDTTGISLRVLVEIPKKKVTEHYITINNPSSRREKSSIAYGVRAVVGYFGACWFNYKKQEPSEYEASGIPMQSIVNNIISIDPKAELISFCRA